MFGQTFEFLDLARMGFLALLEILLSADNAIVLGLLIRCLPVEQRKKALFIGIASAIIIRGAALFAVSLLLRATWIQLLGGIYLLYLCLSHLCRRPKETTHAAIPHPRGFWKSVILIELYDLVFAIDSVVVAVAFISAIPSTGTIHPKLWIVYAGALSGLILIRFAATWFSSVIDRFPRMETMAYFMIGWIGLKLSFTGMESYHLLPASFMHYFEPPFWIILSILFILGFTKKKTHV